MDLTKYPEVIVQPLIPLNIVFKTINLFLFTNSY